MSMIQEHRRRRDQDGEEWKLSFADMMTLILCFFILAVSVSRVDDTRFTEVAQSLGQAMGAKKEKPKSQPEVPEALRKRLKTLKELKADISTRMLVHNDVVDLDMRPDSVAVNLRGPVFFQSGSAELTGRARDVLASLAPELTGIPYRLKIEGHTDDIPIASAQFPSNWELSAARAAAVARFIIERGFPKDKVEITGLADTRPTAPNIDPLGRPLPENQARNRRIAIIVTP